MLTVSLLASAIASGCGALQASEDPTHLVVASYVGAPRVPVDSSITATSVGQPTIATIVSTWVDVPMNAMVQTSVDGQVAGRIDVHLSAADSAPPCLLAGSVDRFMCQTRLAHKVIYDEHTIHWPHQALGVLEDTVWLTVNGRIAGDSAVGTVTYEQHSQGTMTDSFTLQPVTVTARRGPASTNFVLR